MVVFPAMPVTIATSCIDGDHLLGADIHRAVKSERIRRKRAFQAFVDIEERAGLLAVAPDFDLSAVGGLATLRQTAAGAFPVRRSRCLPDRRCCGSARSGSRSVVAA